jgi:hypothetical protein
MMITQTQGKAEVTESSPSQYSDDQERALLRAKILFFIVCGPCVLKYTEFP